MHHSRKGSSTLEAAIIFPLVISLVIFVIFSAFFFFEKNSLLCSVNLMLSERSPEAGRIPEGHFQRSLVTNESKNNYFFFDNYILSIEYRSRIPFFKGGLKISDKFEKRYVSPETFIRNADFFMESAKELKELIIP